MESEPFLAVRKIGFFDPGRTSTRQAMLPTRIGSRSW